MRIELTIKTSYLESWGLWEGIRELVQNARDAEVQFGAPMRVSFKSNRLVIENEGCGLEHRALLLGHTTKKGAEGLIGQFGEGLKLGALALARAGYAVRIQTNGETWTPALEKSEWLDEPVLVFHIRKSRAKKPDLPYVRVEVSGLSEEGWTSLRRNFRFLDKKEDDLSVVPTRRGDLLLDPEEAGRLYVKGVFVEYNPVFKHGYDYQSADTDRDRRMVNSFDRTYYAAQIWNEALTHRADLLAAFAESLQEQHEDVRGFESTYTAGDIPKETQEKLAALFTEKYGEDAVPAASLEESADIEHLGLRGVVCSKAQKNVFDAVLGERANKAELGFQTVNRFSWSDLDSVERKTIEDVLALTELTDIPVKLADLDVVEFRDSRYIGRFYEGRILVARKILIDFSRTLRAVVHESAHRLGGDGSKGHVDASEVALATIAAFLWSAS